MMGRSNLREATASVPLSQGMTQWQAAVISQSDFQQAMTRGQSAAFLAHIIKYLGKWRSSLPITQLVWDVVL